MVRRGGVAALPQPARASVQGRAGMSFDTLPFLGFFAVVIAAYYAAGGAARGWWLLVAGVAGYSVAGLRDTVLFLVVISANYAFSLYVRERREVLWAALAFNFGVLAWYKYRLFLMGMAGIGGTAGVPGGTSGSFTEAVVIPLGISFYIFTCVAYLVDIARGEIAPDRSFPRFALFISYFPHWVAGPIVRAHVLLPQVKRIFAGNIRWPRLWCLGLGLCLLGVVKKVVGADSLAPFVDDIFTRGPGDAATAWLGIWLFAFQIYFDFSGYSDMAVGMSWLLGVRLPMNFLTPYLALSPREFWQRWHITLSTWIRDYLYIPLGGSKGGGAARQALVLIVVMGLAGLWHGANWTYIVWGLAWGAAIAAWRIGHGPIGRLPGAVQWAATMLVVLTLWVLFRAPDIGFAGRYIAAMWGGAGLGEARYFGGSGGLPVLAGAASLMLLHVAERMGVQRRGAVYLVKRWEGPLLRGVLVAMILWLLVMPKLNANPFIYFRF